MTHAARLSLIVGLAALGCAHSEPFDPSEAQSLGPPGSAPPRRLTFNVGDDRSPAVAGADLVYSRYDPSRGTPAQCLARLPAEGGTLQSLWCPPGPTPADTFVSTWLEPALADDGSAAVAFVWQRGSEVSALAAWSHHLVVSPVSAPGAPTVQILLADSVGGVFYNTAFELTWAGPGRVRFLAAYEFIPKVKGGGPDRFTDTTLVPAGLLELDVAAGLVREVPGGAGVTAYAATPDGLWVVRADTLWRLDDAGTAIPLFAVGPFVNDIAYVDGRMVAARLSPDGGGVDTTVLWWDSGSGMSGQWIMPGPSHRLTAIGGRRFVAEVEADGRVFGAPANLWLLEAPPHP